MDSPFTELHQILSTYFDKDELKTLCSRLKVDYDNLPGDGKMGKARELIAYLERRGRLPQLLEEVKLLRPNIFQGDKPRVDRPDMQLLRTYL
jgi:hypothetical protein